MFNYIECHNYKILYMEDGWWFYEKPVMAGTTIIHIGTRPGYHYHGTTTVIIYIHEYMCINIQHGYRHRLVSRYIYNNRQNHSNT